jgi:hypothetical protein
MLERFMKWYRWNFNERRKQCVNCRRTFLKAGKVTRITGSCEYDYEKITTPVCPHCRSKYIVEV